jgi:hypothetical protein
MWLQNADKWGKEKKICEVLLGQHKSYLHDFLNATCTSRYAPPHSNWCVIDDDLHPLWYNSAKRDSFQLSWENPLPDQIRPGRPNPVIPELGRWDHVLSKFVFLDEETGEKYIEYIEPLVSHLRFPLAKCLEPQPNKDIYRHYYTGFRGYIIPPPSIRNNRAIYFDAGTTSTASGAGGPSFLYFDDVWRRHGVEFTNIYAFERDTTELDFFDKVSPLIAIRTKYQQAEIASSPNEHSKERPFIPMFIKEHSEPGDYVLLKLDVDLTVAEDESILYLLDQVTNYVDELAWEHHIRGNYLLQEWGPPEQRADISIRESMEFFLLMRQRGIRAHSWI